MRRLNLRTPSKNGANMLNNNLGKTPTPQQVLTQKGKRFGNNLDDGQGSSVIAYDHLQIATGLNQQGTEFRFFENAANRAFPFTNLMEGRLPVAEGMVLKRIWFTMMSVVAATGEILDEQTFAAYGLPGLYKSDFTFMNGNSRVIKPTPLSKQKAQWNWKGWNATSDIIHLDTDITLQPLIEFVCSLRIPTVTVPAVAGHTQWLGCYIEGPGAILNPRTNY